MNALSISAVKSHVLFCISLGLIYYLPFLEFSHAVDDFMSLFSCISHNIHADSDHWSSHTQFHTHSSRSHPSASAISPSIMMTCSLIHYPFLLSRLYFHPHLGSLFLMY
ncbi:hypothetical protein CPB86DRAFT_283040 [Serendipita vermifera]|nr:hypothetical protein CPB86DRAFT_283040 [Serendipita vermifera]